VPANLPPHYFEAERRYREAREPAEKVKALEEMLMIMPKHKGTDKLRASLRRKISAFKARAVKKKGVSKRDSAYSIDREGASQVIVVGPPNSGKSSLVARLTNAKPEVNSFPHSTWKPTPGMVPYENIQFQLVDTPPLTADYVEPLMADLIRRGDIVAVLIDMHNGPLKQFDDTFALLQDLRIFPDGFPVPQDLKKPPFIKKMLVLVNKLDNATDEEDYEIFLELWETKLPCIGISTRTGKNLERFVEMVYDLSDIIRVFTKAPGKKHDTNHPFVLPQESTLEDLAVKVHKDFVTNLKFARVWGKAVFDGQMVQRDHVLQDGDVVEIHT
jgi:ribosome-interacting GTPase 1